MKKTWQFQEAKNRLSEVLDNSLKDGPQIITRHGKEEAVILSIKEYRKINRPKKGLVDFFLNSPLCNTNLDFERSRDEAREVIL